MSKFYDFYQGHTYMISGSDEYGNNDSCLLDSPLSALMAWFRIGAKFPTGTSIQCKHKSDAVALCETAISHKQSLTELHQKYKCPYKLDFIFEQAEKKVSDGCKYFHEHGDFGDSVYPFDIG